MPNYRPPWVPAEAFRQIRILLQHAMSTYSAYRNTRMHVYTRATKHVGSRVCLFVCASVRSGVCAASRFQDDDVKVTIGQPDAESAGSTPVAFVEGRMNCAAATAIMDMQVQVCCVGVVFTLNCQLLVPKI